MSLRREYSALCVVAVFSLLITGSGDAGSPGEPDIRGTGRIVYLDFEGGFFGIIAEDGSRYDPVNLPDEFKVDGLRVSFEAIKTRSQVGFHMWGTLIEIISIRRL